MAAKHRLDVHGRVQCVSSLEVIFRTDFGVTCCDEESKLEVRNQWLLATLVSCQLAGSYVRHDRNYTTYEISSSKLIRPEDPQRFDHDWSNSTWAFLLSPYFIAP